jgi:hypothetical protein
MGKFVPKFIKYTQHLDVHGIRCPFIWEMSIALNPLSDVKETVKYAFPYSIEWVWDF